MEGNIRWNASLDEFTYIFFLVSLKTPSPHFYLLFQISCSLSLSFNQRFPKFSFSFFFLLEIESKVTIVTIVRRQKVYLLEILLRKQAHGKRRNLLSNIFIPSRRFVREKIRSDEI